MASVTIKLSDFNLSTNIVPSVNKENINDVNYFENNLLSYNKFQFVQLSNISNGQFVSNVTSSNLYIMNGLNVGTLGIYKEQVKGKNTTSFKLKYQP